MCKLVAFRTNFGEVCQVADVKIDYLYNILDTASECSDIDRIVLFGSALEERCNGMSDIDIAIFGDKTETKFLRSRQFKQFERAIYSFGEFQDYDLLYFQNGKEVKANIMNDIALGKVIYCRKADVC